MTRLKAILIGLAIGSFGLLSVLVGVFSGLGLHTSLLITGYVFASFGPLIGVAVADEWWKSLQEKK